MPVQDKMEQCQARASRRAFLAGAALAGATLPSVGAQADAHDCAFDAILARGEIRFSTTIWLAQLPLPPAPPTAPPKDHFNEEVAALIARGLGVRHSVTHPSAGGEALQKLRNNEVDVVLGPMLNTLTARLMLLTPPYAQVESVILSAEPGRRRNLADWAGMRVGIQQGFDLHLAHLGFDISAVRPVTYANLVMLEAALLSGEVTAVIVTSIAARSLTARHPGMRWRVQATLAPHLHAAAVRFGQHDLLCTISHIIEGGLVSGEIPRLFARTTGTVLPPLRRAF